MDELASGGVAAAGIRCVSSSKMKGKNVGKESWNLESFKVLCGNLVQQKLP